MLLHESFEDLQVNGSNTMRVHIYRPRTAEDSNVKFGAVCVFTEIYQVTGPVERLCRRLASFGLLVVSPESYHEFEPLGTVLSYDEIGTNKGNEYKVKKSIQAFDADAKVLVSYLLTRSDCSGRIASLGMCLGGHLALRCAFLPDVLVGVCYFPTDILQGSLGKDGDDSLERMKDLNETELLMIFGKQDRHVPQEGRNIIRNRLQQVEADFSWVEVNARHAFIRDEMSKGRYDAALSDALFSLTTEILSRRIILGMSSMIRITPQSEASGPERC